MTQGKPEGWIEELEIENANVRWGFSNFVGEKRLYNAEGDHNFTINLTEDEAAFYMKDGWNVRHRPGQEEGDPDEFTMKLFISDKFGMPLIHFIKRGRKYPVEYMSELKQIRPDSTTQIDVIATPGKPWEDENNPGTFKRTAYVKELYVHIKESRLGEKYSDYEEVRSE